MNVLEYILNRYSIENLEASINNLRFGYNNFYIDKNPIYDYDGSKKYLIKWIYNIKDNKYKNNLLYFLYKDNQIYLVNYNKKYKNYEYHELMHDIFMDYRIFDLISSYYSIK